MIVKFYLQIYFIQFTLCKSISRLVAGLGVHKHTHTHVHTTHTHVRTFIHKCRTLVRVEYLLFFRGLSDDMAESKVCT
jgi:hypothetical protein